LSADVITATAAIVGGGFFGGLLIGYAIKKVVKLIAVQEIAEQSKFF
jgi:uncharacterized membrane protein (Fun14 family)